MRACGVEFFLLLLSRGSRKKKNGTERKQTERREKLLTLPVNCSATELLLTEFQNLAPAAVSPGRASVGMAGTAGTRLLYAAPSDLADGSAAWNADLISGDAGRTSLAAPLSTMFWKLVMLLPSWAHLTWVELRNLSTKEMLARAGPGIEKLPCFLVLVGFGEERGKGEKRRETNKLVLVFFSFSSSLSFSLSLLKKKEKKASSHRLRLLVGDGLDAALRDRDVGPGDRGVRGQVRDRLVGDLFFR